MYNDKSDPTLTNVTFSSNTAVIGGGMYNYRFSNPTLTNVTFSANFASNFADGMLNTTGSRPTLTNTIIANNNSLGCFGWLHPASSNNLIESTGSNVCGLTNGVNGNIIGNPTANAQYPFLGALTDNGGFTQTHALLTGSPATDAGATCPATDQRGVTRPQPAGGACDIGAYEAGAIIPVVQSSDPSTNATITSLFSITVVFNQDMQDDTSVKGAENTNNYLLVERGANNTFETISCAGGTAATDTPQTISAANYINTGGIYISTLTLASPLTAGTYRLFVCGTTSIWSAAGLELNNGASDYTANFTFASAAATAATLPTTGFTPNKTTSLPAQPANSAYAALGSLWLEIPSQNIKTNIVGVPQSKNTWDVKWLGQDAGWLNGTAFPSWQGNSVLTAHVTDSNGLPGPFANLKNLGYGDQIIVHMLEEQYIFEVRNKRLVRPDTAAFAFEHLEDNSFLTLITCSGYDEQSDSYRLRRVVRAVLMDVR
jgi:LPXTG-site transpeptidase (sortase) family protein